MPVAVILTNDKNLTEKDVIRAAEDSGFFDEEDDVSSYISLLNIKGLNTNGIYVIQTSVQEEELLLNLTFCLDEQSNYDYFIRFVSTGTLKQREINLVFRDFKDEYRGIQNYVVRVIKFLKTTYNLNIEDYDDNQDDDSVDILFKLFNELKDTFKMYRILDNMLKSELIIHSSSKKQILGEAENILNDEEK